MVVAYLIVLDILPPPPTNMEVNPISPSQLKIQWTMPKDVSLVDHFVLNITRLSVFDDEPRVPKKKIDKDENKAEDVPPTIMQVKVESHSEKKIT